MTTTTYKNHLTKIYQQWDSEWFDKVWGKASEKGLCEYDDIISDMTETKCRDVVKYMLTNARHYID